MSPVSLEGQQSQHRWLAQQHRVQRWTRARQSLLMGGGEEAVHAQAALCVPLPESLIPEAIIGGRPSCFLPWERTQILCFLLGSILCRLQEACMPSGFSQVSDPPSFGFLIGLLRSEAFGPAESPFLSASPFLHLLVCSTCPWDSTHMAPLPQARVFPATSLLNLAHPCWGNLR